MADNVELDVMTGGDNIAADDIAGVKYQRVKIVLGADGVNDGDVSSANAVPVDGSGVTQPVSAASLPLPSGAATAANQQTDALTDTELRATAVPVSLASVPSHPVTNAGTFATQATLQAGSNAIGKLAANSGVDIGDVDVTSLANGALNGPAEPTIDSYTQVAINLNAAANQVLVAAPGASKQIWVYGVTYTCSVAGTVSFQDEDDTALSGIMDHAANSGLSHSPSGNFAMPIWKVATNKALEVDVVTAAIDGWLNYAVVSV